MDKDTLDFILLAIAVLAGTALVCEVVNAIQSHADWKWQDAKRAAARRAQAG